MKKYVIRRLVSVIPVLWLVSILVFSLIHLVPGDPFLVILGTTAERVQVEAMRHKLGLDQPILVQYGTWIAGLLRGDLGHSIISDERVMEMILPRMPVTLTVVNPPPLNVEVAMAWFMTDPPHAKNILNPNYAAVGVGIGYNGRQWLLVQNFAGSN